MNWIIEFLKERKAKVYTGKGWIQADFKRSRDAELVAQSLTSRFPGIRMDRGYDMIKIYN